MPSTTTTSSSPSSAVTASVVAVTLFLFMAVLQVEIAAGLLPVTIVWGGSQSQPTWQTSLASLVAAGLLMGMAWVIHRRVQPTPPVVGIRVTSWIITAYMVLNTVGNALSTNVIEQYIFGTLTTALAVSCCVVSCSSVTAGEGNGAVDFLASREYESLP
uniref:Uncharacterized protein n=1 Tax=Amphora coffeiformis TaxID=265554 RepID=A0A7S3L6W9_9STRA|mmetsp:Transcript_17464/g.33176  ORF Transcript_17464/g.33176 Transcript_17464/m.33176 type:complete len:159 (-) Transcript_17464:272-748(-)|eukprot:scaffold34603_cov212-Amphora_coffeaeformis.AAC.17